MKLSAVNFFFALLLGTVANATPVTWTLSPLDFNTFPGSQGASASGSFTYDADVNVYSNWNIDIVGFRIPSANAVLTPTNSLQGPFAATEFALSYNSSSEFILSFGSVSTFFQPEPLTDAGGTVKVFAAVGAVDTSFRIATTSGTASSVPEPPYVSLILIGGVILCASSILLHRKRFERKNQNDPLHGTL